MLGFASMAFVWASMVNSLLSSTTNHNGVNLVIVSKTHCLGGCVSELFFLGAVWL